MVSGLPSVMRFWVVGGVLAVLMLAGCAETQLEETDDSGGDTDAGAGGSDAAAVDATGNATADAGSLAGRLVASVENTTVTAGVPFNVTLDYTDDNSTDAGSLAWNATFQNATDSVSYDGTGLPAVLEANLTLLGDVTLQAAAGDGADNVTMELGLTVLEPVTGPVEPEPEGGTTGARATGAAVAVLNNRAAFDIAGAHPTLEYTPELEDPLAQEGGQGYQIRLYTPDGREITSTAHNGDVLVLNTPPPGAYEVTVWPVAAGDYAFTIDYCAFTSVHCTE